MKNTILILLIILCILGGTTLTLALMVAIKQLSLIIPFTGLMTVCGIISSYSLYLSTKTDLKTIC